MRRLVADIWNHRALFSVTFVLQATTCMAPYVLLFVYSPLLHESLLANVADYFSAPLVLFWLWFAAVGMIAVGGFWSAEVSERFCLEVWRHSSFTQWLRRKLLVVVAASVFVYGLIPLPFLLATYPREIPSVVAVCGFLALYGLHLSLALIGASMLGIRSSSAFGGVLSYHAINLLFNHLGWPNTVQYFLIAEQASTTSFLAALGFVGLVLGLMLRGFGPTAMTTRGSEYL